MRFNVQRMCNIAGACLLFLAVQVRAQPSFDISYSFEHERINIQGNQTFANKLIVKNNKNQSVKLSTTAKGTQALGGLISLPDTLHLTPFENRSYPLKYIADRNTIKEARQLFAIELNSIEPTLTVQPGIAFEARLDEPIRLSLSPQQSEYYLDPGNHQTTVTIVAHNQGFVQVNFNLQLIEIPEGLDFTGELGNIQLAPGQQVLLPFHVRNKYINRQTDYLVHLKAVDDYGSTIAEQRIKIMTISSIKRVNSQFYDDTRTNFISLQFQNMNYNQSGYRLQGNGKINLGNFNRLSYSMNMELIQDFEHLFLYNTYLDYEGKTWGVKLGNITEDLDFQISGRGVSMRKNFNNNASVSFFGVENNYLLTNNFNQITFPKVFGATFKNTSIANNSLFSIIHSNDGERDIQSNQVNARSLHRLSQHQTLKWEAGLSAERVLRNTPIPGISGSFEYIFDQQGFRLSSSHHWSSPYYTGLRRGLFQSETSIHVNLNNLQTLSARVNVVKNNAKYPISQHFLNQNFNMENNLFEMGYALKLGNLRLDVRPYFQHQLTDLSFSSIFNPSDIKREFRSYRNRSHLSLSLKEHRLTLDTDLGITNAQDINQQWDTFKSLRFNALYHYRNIGFSSFIQLNPYYISDQLNSTALNKYRVYSFGPNFNIHLFKNQLQVQANGNYNYYNHTKTSNISLNSNMKLKMKGNWAVTASAFIAEIQQTHLFNQANSNLYTHNYFSNQQYRIGIEKNFSSNANNSVNKLGLKYFDDINNNGIQDDGEMNIQGIVVKLANHFAVTDKKGEVKFYNLPEGNYNIQIINSKGWQLAGSEHVFLNKNIQMSVPLLKFGKLHGVIEESNIKYITSQENLAGIPIIARDVHGKSFKTLTNQQGRFTMYLPAGNYDVYVENDGLAFKISDNKKNVLIDINKPKHIDFEYKTERRKVDIKKF